jgi:DASH complex subunit ASK1
MTSVQNSFIPAQAACSSTPASSDAHQEEDAWTSPLKLRNKPKTPIAKNLNPYLPPNTKPADWSGIVDLTHPSMTTPQRHLASRSQTFLATKDVTPDESFDGLPVGMSPPVLLSPARPPRSSAELTLGKTPVREAAERITQDLISDVQRKTGGGLLRRMQISGVESSMSTLPTPPSFSRYHPGGRYGTDTSESLAVDSSLENMMRRVGLRPPSFGPGLGSTETPFPPSQVVTPPPNPIFYGDDDHDSYFDSDSLDDVNNTAHPSAAFLMASRGRQGADDSFGSSNRSSDSLSEEDVAEGLAPVNPFGRGVVGDDGDGFDDSFYDDGSMDDGAQESTLFGVPAVQRLQDGARFEHVRMLGEDRLQETIDVGNKTAREARATETPTPANANAYASSATLSL